MSEMLALKYRPLNFRDIAGQRPVKGILMRMIHDRGEPGQWVPRSEHKVPQALLFWGPHGAGKTSTARILAAALNCESEGERPCGTCASCKAVQEGSSLAVTEMDAASSGTVEAIRAIRDQAQHYQSVGRRVYLLDEAHSMSRDAFNALLKVLEEPPTGTTFVLITTERAKIMTTVASRCMPFPFRRLSAQEIIERLKMVCEAESIGADDELLRLIASRSDGAMRDALVAIDQADRSSITTARPWRYLMGEHDYGSWLLKAMADGDHAAVFSKLDEILLLTGDYASVGAELVSTLRDLLVISAGGSVTAEGDDLAARQALAAQIPVPRLVAAMEVLWSLRTLVRTDARSALELAVVVCMEKLGGKKAGPVIATSNGHSQAATIGQLRAYAR